MSSCVDTQPSIAAPRPRPILRYEIERSASTALGIEPRRALAVLRALDIDRNRAGAHSLLSFAGSRIRRDQDRLCISERECHEVATALRRAGYPLDDAGVSRFKEERGYSRIMRISPEVAAAYARYADGLEARIEVAPEYLRRMSTEARRALKLLLLIGRKPAQLVKVRQCLKLEEREPARDGIIPVGRTSAKRLLAWGFDHGIYLSDKGIKKINLALASTERLRPIRRLERLADPIARWIIAADEPMHDYKRLAASAGDRPALLSRRTFVMLARAEGELTEPLRIMRGSYEEASGRGAHPHQGGGAVDLELEDDRASNLVRCVVALRRVGFAAWYRPREGRPHVHALAIGDRDLSPAAQWQVKSYFQGRDGRSRSEPDPHKKIAVPLPEWVIKYGVRYG